MCVCVCVCLEREEERWFYVWREMVVCGMMGFCGFWLKVLSPTDYPVNMNAIPRPLASLLKSFSARRSESALYHPPLFCTVPLVSVSVVEVLFHRLFASFFFRRNTFIS